MASRAQFQPDKIAATMQRGEAQTQKVSLALVGLDGGDYHLEPGPKPAYNEHWANPAPAGLRLSTSNKAEAITVQLHVPDDAKFGTHHLQVVAQNEDEPTDQTAVDIAITVPVAETRNLIPWVLIIILVIIVIVALIWYFTKSNPPAAMQELPALVSAVLVS